MGVREKAKYFLEKVWAVKFDILMAKTSGQNVWSRERLSASRILKKTVKIDKSLLAINLLKLINPC